MSDSTAQAKSKFAQGKAVKAGAKSKFSQGKAVTAKAAKFNKAVGKHLLLFFLVGLFLGTTAFIPFFAHPGVSLAGYTYIGIALLSLFLGQWNGRRAAKKIDWYEGNTFGPRMWLALGVFASLFAGILLVYVLLSAFVPFVEVPLSLSLLFAVAPITLLVPLLVGESFERVAAIQPKDYTLWVYPENYVEKQPTWNRDRIVFANLHFKRNERENLITTVKVKLPKEALLGELVYLFMRDYNENRSPDNPILQVTSRDGVDGWLFKTNNKGIAALFKKKRIVNVDLTIEENKIEEDQDLFFERVISTDL